MCIRIHGHVVYDDTDKSESNEFDTMVTVSTVFGTHTSTNFQSTIINCWCNEQGNRTTCDHQFLIQYVQKVTLYAGHTSVVTSEESNE